MLGAFFHVGQPRRHQRLADRRGRVQVETHEASTGDERSSAWHRNANTLRQQAA